MIPALAHIDCWIFDLDNSLYPSSADLFALIDVRMRQFIENLLGCDTQEAHRVQKAHFHEHGTTLAGLMAEHGVDPHDFLAYVHDIDLARISADPIVVDALGRLPGRRFIFTNGDAPYAERVLGRLGLADLFEAIYDIHAMDYVPKPDPRPYRLALARLNAAPEHAVFVAGSGYDLFGTHRVGLRTYWHNRLALARPEGAPAPDCESSSLEALPGWVFRP